MAKTLVFYPKTSRVWDPKHRDFHRKSSSESSNSEDILLHSDEETLQLGPSGPEGSPGFPHVAVASNCCNLTVKLSTSPHLSLGWESHPDQSKKVFFLWKLLGLENSHGNEHYPIFTWSYNKQGIKVYQPSSATSIPPLSQASCLHRRGYLLARQKNTQEIA